MSFTPSGYTGGLASRLTCRLYNVMNNVSWMREGGGENGCGESGC